MIGSAQPTAEQRTLLERWLEELHRWNARINLTAVPPEQAWGRHVGESLRLLGHASLWAGSAVVDVGSGGGAPGLPIAIVRPEARVTLIDSDSRKAAFLAHVVGLLHIADRVTVLDRRAEIIGRELAHREAYDLAVSRAAAPAATLCELALPLVRPGGALVALMSDAQLAAARSRRACELVGGGRPAATEADILLVRKIAPTGVAYPRRDGLPARRPLA